MLKRRVWVLAAVWVSSLITVGLWAQGTAAPQIQGTTTPQVEIFRPGDAIGEVISGSDIGFQRVAPQQAERGGTVSGYLVVRVGGEWLIATAPMSLRRMAAN
jgi:hypothetical protein